jgi:nitrilase
MHTPHTKTIRVAAVQAGSRLFDTAGTLEEMRALCLDAKTREPHLIVFPEAYIGGYPKGMDFGARVGSRSACGRSEFLRYSNAAIDIAGPEVKQIGRIARLAAAHLVVGAIERQGSTLYCSVLFFGPDGTLLKRRRKLMPTGTERLIWGMGDGSDVVALDTPFGTISAAICWENYMPAFRMALYARGTMIWCAPTVDDRDIWQSSMRHIAYEGRCFVISACQHVPENPTAGEAHADTPRPTTAIRGGSVIIDPLGTIIAGPVYDREAILHAELDLDDIARGKFDLDVVGHYARPDIFDLKINARAASVATFEPIAS